MSETLILDTIPVIDLNFIIIEGALITIVLGTLLVFSSRATFFFLSRRWRFYHHSRGFHLLTHVGIHPDNIIPG